VRLRVVTVLGPGGSPASAYKRMRALRRTVNNNDAATESNTMVRHPTRPPTGRSSTSRMRIGPRRSILSLLAEALLGFGSRPRAGVWARSRKRCARPTPSSASPTLRVSPGRSRNRTRYEGGRPAASSSGC
jgi:hypothetical protein